MKEVSRLKRHGVDFFGRMKPDRHGRWVKYSDALAAVFGLSATIETLVKQRNAAAFKLINNMPTLSYTDRKLEYIAAVKRLDEEIEKNYLEGTHETKTF